MPNVQEWINLNGPADYSRADEVLELRYLLFSGERNSY